MRSDQSKPDLVGDDRIARSILAIQKHGTFVLIATLALVAGGVWSAAGLHWREDIADLLPRDDASVSGYFEVVERFRFMDYVYFRVGSHDPEVKASEDDLVAYADALHDRLSSSDLFEKIIYRWDMRDLEAAMQKLSRYRASLFTRKDAEILDAKTSEEAIFHSLREWKRLLTESPAPFVGPALYEDPLAIGEVFADKLRAVQAVGSPLTVHEGRLFSSDHNSVLLIALPTFPSTDSHRSAELLRFIEGSLNELDKQVGAGRFDVRYFGGHRAAVDNATRIDRDIRLTVALSVVAIALLSYAIFSRTYLVLLTFVPVVVGASIALGLVRFIDPRISAIIISCGSMLIGISVDYAIHFLYGLDRQLDSDDSPTTLAMLVRSLLAPVSLSALTTMAAFGVLGISLMPGYRSLGLFGALGIFFAAATSLIVLPALTRSLRPRSKRRPLIGMTKAFGTVLDRAASCKTAVIFACAALTVVGAIGVSRLQFDGDVRKLNSMSSKTQEGQDAVVSAFGDVMGTTAFAVSSDDLQSALEANERLARLLRSDSGDTIVAVGTIAELLPSSRAQEENRHRWYSFWSNDRLNSVRQNIRSACSELGMKSSAFDRFLSSLPGDCPRLDHAEFSQGLIGQILGSQMAMGKQDVTILTRVKLASPDDFKKVACKVAESEPDVMACNGRSFVSHVVEMVRKEMTRLGTIILAVVAILMFAVVRRIKLVLAMLVPLLASLVWTLGLFGWLDIRLNIVSAMIAIFVFGLIADYSIFLAMAMRRSGAVDDRKHLLRTGGAIVVSALTTMCGLGALSFARHPALHSIGFTALVGISFGLVAVVAIVPLLLARRRAVS